MWGENRGPSLYITVLGADFCIADFQKLTSGLNLNK